MKKFIADSWRCWPALSFFPAKQEQRSCGIHTDKAREELDLHLQSRAARPSVTRKSRPGQNRRSRSFRTSGISRIWKRPMAWSPDGILSISTERQSDSFRQRDQEVPV